MNCPRISFLTMALLLLMVCGCALSSSISPSESQPLPVSEPLADMLSAAMIYETACAGVDFNGSDYSAVINYPYVWLHQNGLLGGFSKTDAQSETEYTLPQPLTEALCQLFFGIDISPQHEQYALTYYDTYNNSAALPYTLIAPDTLPEPEGDGSYKITFARASENGMFLREVSYCFMPVVLEDTPVAPVNSIYQKGDTLWRIVSVSNLSKETLPREQYETIYINTVDDLMQLSADINSGKRAAQQKRYLLGADLDLSGISFAPIGSNRSLISNDIRDDNPTGFNAVFDGQGHTISNFSLSMTPPESPDSPLMAGFFANIGKDGQVKNLTLKNASVSTPVLDAPAASVVMTGLMAGGCSGEIENCHVSGKVIGSYQTGGFAGFIGNYVDDDEAQFAQVTRCTADISVAGDSELGGFAGSLNGAFVTECSVTGEVIAVAGNIYGAPRAIGGFCGFSVVGNVDSCEASVYVKTQLSSEWVGAFMGSNQGSITRSRYNLDKAPYWEPVDVIYHGAVSEVEAYSQNVKPITR